MLILVIPILEEEIPGTYCIVRTVLYALHILYVLFTFTQLSEDLGLLHYNSLQQLCTHYTIVQTNIFMRTQYHVNYSAVIPSMTCY